MALMANFLSGKERILRRVLAVFRDFSWAGRAFLMALVFLGRRSRGLYFFPLYNFLRFSFCFWCITMWTRATDFLMTRILESLEAAPPVTLATRSWASSVLRSSSCLVSSSFFFLRSSEHFILPIAESLVEVNQAILAW